jgi:hypothetical protein
MPNYTIAHILRVGDGSFSPTPLLAAGDRCGADTLGVAAFRSRDVRCWRAVPDERKEDR